MRRWETMMGKPTQEEFEAALSEAKRMREQGEDAQHLAKAFLNLNYHSELPRNVLHAAEIHLQSGMAEREHTQLVKAIEKARAADDLGAHPERSAPGL